MPRVPRRKRLTRRAGWWKDSSKKSAKKSAESVTPALDTAPSLNDAPSLNATPAMVHPINPISEHPLSDPTINPYPIVHGQVDHETDNPANHEYLQNAEDLIQHLKRQLRKPCENHMQYPGGEL